MKTSFRKIGTILMSLVLAGGLAWSSAAPAHAEDLSTGQLIQSLKPKPLTRGLTTHPIDHARALEDQHFVDNVRQLHSTRGLTVTERNKIADIADTRPSVDLTIYFDYNSATLRQESLSQLDDLGHALTSQDLNGSTFMIAGHTDAKGSAAYNQDLSQRRAEAVKQYLVTNCNVHAESLVAAGYGKDRLKNTNDPFSGENRRVQVANLASQPVASK